MYKLVVLDIDDTIVNSKYKISEKTKKAILAAKNKGIKVTLASGRIHQAMKNVAQELDITLPLISCNGALIKNNTEIINKSELNQNAAQNIIDFFNKRSRTLQLYTSDGLFTKEKCERTWRLEQHEGVPCNIIDSIEYDNFNASLLKALIRLEPDEVEQYRYEVSKHLGNEIDSALSHKVYLEMTQKGVTKGRAVSILADYLSIEQKNVMTIGDSPNDKSMLKWAGLGIAMGNASDEVKNAADQVTLSIEDDGVAHAFEKYIL